MATLNPGDAFPSDVVFKYIPWTEESDDITACGIPINYNASKEWANKKVVLFSVPDLVNSMRAFEACKTCSPTDASGFNQGAFTPTCSVNHMPGYIKNLPQLREKGVDIVAVVAFNDPFVMSAWGKANKVRNNEILFLSDPEAKFSKSIGWADAASGRTGRYAIIIDHGKVKYADIETEKGAVKGDETE
ncbi:hypothetical protein N7532_009786 [Penicillium argentinense]|uniref:Redoxin domain-containing protein n=1 Tax=Penicillium argentinense TaxID=1131581 RepID=A0A9W9ENK8_9EURO|nr:uncharacterized protein N7532_009786 [Penicillium argentinense]KAJ5085015.1 hypothetical protein N7532_009786 [Penicillium argentinense]